MQPKTINLETATVEELKIAVYDIMADKDFYQSLINEINKQISVFNQAIRDKMQKQPNPLAPVLGEKVALDNVDITKEGDTTVINGKK